MKEIITGNNLVLLINLLLFTFFQINSTQAAAIYSQSYGNTGNLCLFSNQGNINLRPPSGLVSHTFINTNGEIAPYVEPFNVFIPNNWVQSATTGGPWEIEGSFPWNTFGCNETPDDHTGNFGGFLTMDFTATDEGVIIEMPEVDVTALTTSYLQFYFFMCGSGYSPFNRVYVEAYNGSTWVLVGIANNGTASWETYNYDISAHIYNTSFVKIRFRAESGGANNDSFGDIALDDIAIIEKPCFSPNTLIAGNITTTTADLLWTSGGSGESTWDIEWGPTGFSQGSGATILGTMTNPYHLSGLTVGTAYDFYVKANCGGASASSLWTGPKSFVTSCITEIAPYTESFDAFIDPCWSNYASTGGPWEINGTWIATTSCPGSPGDHTGNGGKYVIMNFSGTDIGVILSMPEVDVSALSTPVVQFYHYMCGAGYAPLNEIYVEAYDGSSWHNVATVNTGSNSWEAYAYNLSSHIYNTNLVKIRFRAESGGAANDYYGGMALDDISIIDDPCFRPSSLTATNITIASADLAWTQGFSGESTWNLEWGLQGFSQGSGTLVSGIAASSYALSGLTENTAYDFYVQADCGGTGTSLWEGAHVFTTECAAIATFDENVDGVTIPNLPDCWGKIIGDGAANAQILSTQNPTHSPPYCIQLYNDTAPSSVPIILVSPLLSNLNAGTHRLRFFARTFNTLQDIKVGTITDPSDDATFSSLQTVSIDGVYAEYTVDFSGYVGQDTYIAIRCFSTVSANYSHVFLDDLVWEVNSCVEPNTLTVTNITDNSVNLAWTSGGSGESQWDIEWGAMGFSVGSGTTTSGLASNTHTLSDLNFGTTYDFYVRADCGGGEVSTWAGPFSFSTTCSAATAIYVDVNAVGNNNGTSWTNAFTNLQDGINTQCDALAIWVAAGTYLPTAPPDGASADNRDKAFHWANDMEIYGGFAGTETTLSQRNAAINVTILSGDFNNNDVVTGMGSTLSFTGNTENAYHVFVTANLTSAAVIDGFTILKGNADGSGSMAWAGQSLTRDQGAAGQLSTSNLVFSNCIFTENNSGNGGAIFNQNASPAYVNCLFTKNKATYGGAIHGFNSPATITNCTFSGNNAPNGSAINNNGSSVVTTNTIFWGNGGGACINFYNGSTPTFKNSLVEGSGGSGSWSSSYGTNNGNNIDVDPLFWDASNRDFRLNSDSPALDTGDNNSVPAGMTTDLAHNTRIQNMTVDMGGYEGAVVLPIEFVFFKGEATLTNIQLKWETAFEKNNAYFQVQRSRDAKKWTTIGRQEGKGTTNDITNYQFQDEQPYHGQNYYRLKQTDLDDKFDYSSTLVIEFKNAANQLQLFPNPVQNQTFTVSFVGTGFEVGELSIFNFTGQKVFSQRLLSTQMKVEMLDLPKGVYLVVLKTSRERFLTRLVFQ